MNYPIYTLLLYAAVPFILLRLFWRSIWEPGYRRHLGERFGYYDQKKPRSVWVHGVSVGELQAAFALIDWLKTQDISLVVTTTTPAGRKTAESLYGAYADIVFLPYDIPGCIQRFFNTFQPDIGFILETELWPNLLAEAKKRHLPICLINARLSERSFKRYKRAKAVAGRMLSSLSAIAAQTPADLERFKALGASGNCFVSGNLKFDRLPDPAMIALGQRWRQEIGDRKAVVFASTRDGEERLLLPAIDLLRQAGILAVVVPRHPNRFEAVFKLFCQYGFICQRRSDQKPIQPDTQVWIGDSLGEMSAYYTLADVAVIGGSWLRYGGQNPIEALAVETPVVVGTHTFHFKQIVEDGVKAKAVVQVDEIDRLGGFLILLLNSHGHYECMRQAAGGFIQAHRGAIERLKRALKPILNVLKLKQRQLSGQKKSAND